MLYSHLIDERMPEKLKQITVHVLEIIDESDQHSKKVKANNGAESPNDNKNDFIHQSDICLTLHELPRLSF